jgi:hypothetical protein
MTVVGRVAPNLRLDDRRIGSVEVLGLFLLPTRRPWRRLTGVEEEASMADALDLFLLPQGQPRPRFSTTMASSKLITLASAMVITTLD